MKISITTEYSPWLIFLCLAAGIGFALILYFRDKKNSELSSRLIGLLFTLRTLSVSVLAFLLLNPLLKSVFREVEKPVIVIAQDASASVVAGKDSAFYVNQYPKALNEFIASVEDKFQVRSYSFGDRFREGTDSLFHDRETDFTSLFQELDTRYNGRNLGAVIVASDGLFNKGMSPVSAASKIKVPLITIALGDTTVYKDLVLHHVIHNKIAFLGNTFPAEVVLKAFKAKNEKAVISIAQKGKILQSQTINIPSDQFDINIPFQLTAAAPGLQHYVVTVAVVDGEKSALNNRQDIYIDVLDARQNILIVGAAPHPDIGALRQTIESNDNYKADVFTLSEFNQPVGKYSLAILHQLPDESQNASKLISDLNTAGIPVLYLTGAENRLNAFNNLKTGLSIQVNSTRANDAEAYAVNDFPLFTVSDDLKNYLPKLPAVKTPFAVYKTAPSVTTFLRQKIGSLKTDYPLWMFSEQNNRKIGIIAADGIWKWRLRDYADHGNHDLFNELISKTVQFLSVKENKSFFRISAESNYPENEPVILEAEVYNQTYELVNEPDAKIEISDSAGKKYDFMFSRSGNAYRLNAGIFRPGEYEYSASVKIGEKTYNQKGRFSVIPLRAEFTNTTANHQELYALSSKHNGKMYFPDQLKTLAQDLLSREDIKPVIYNPKKLIELVNLPWIFVLILLLLSVEWFLRKRNGAY
ncbi:MAG: hypothetical protein Fur0041_04280 [Bacteroidia bacterium]